MSKNTGWTAAKIAKLTYDDIAGMSTEQLLEVYYKMESTLNTRMKRISELKNLPERSIAMMDKTKEEMRRVQNTVGKKGTTVNGKVINDKVLRGVLRGAINMGSKFLDTKKNPFSSKERIVSRELKNFYSLHAFWHPEDSSDIFWNVEKTKSGRFKKVTIFSGESDVGRSFSYKDIREFNSMVEKAFYVINSDEKLEISKAKSAEIREIGFKVFAETGDPQAAYDAMMDAAHDTVTAYEERQKKQAENVRGKYAKNGGAYGSIK